MADPSYRDVSIWSAVEASLGIVAASAYTLRPLFRSILNLTSRATPGYGTSKGGLSHNGQSRTERSRRDRSSKLGIMRIPEPAHTSHAHMHSPFGDSNEDVRGPSQDSDQGGIQVHRTFEIRTGKDEEAHEMEWRNPKQSGSSVSIA
jgi:hypothetical protein